MEEVVRILVMELAVKQPLFWLLMIFALLSTIFYKKLSGFMGEFWVKTELKKLPKDKYIVLYEIFASNIAPEIEVFDITDKYCICGDIL